MMNNKERKQARKDWLKANRSLWEGFPQSMSELWTSKEFSSRHDKIAMQMKSLGLYSKTTNLIDIKLLSLIGEIRKEARQCTPH